MTRHAHPPGGRRTLGIRLATHDIVDRLAIGLSALCLLHCIASALLVAFLATAGSALLDPAIHEIGLLLAMMLAAIALGRGFSRHRHAAPLLLGTIGIGAMGAALHMPHGFHDAGLTIFGVVLVASAHQINRRHMISSRSCTDPERPRPSGQRA